MTVSDDLTWTQGTHTVKFGAEFRLYREHNYDFTNMTPQETFSSRWTNGPLDTSAASTIDQGPAPGAVPAGNPGRRSHQCDGFSAEQSKTA